MASEHEIQTLKDQLANKRLESDKEQARKKHMEKELKVWVDGTKTILYN